MRSAAALLALVLLGSGAVAVYGANGQTANVQNTSLSAYKSDSQTAVYRSAVGVADATSIATLTSTATGEFTLGNAGTGSRSNLSVSARFKITGQTCVIRILYLYRDASTTTGAPTAVLGISVPVTLTATAFTDTSTGYFVAPSFAFDGAGATHCRIICVTAPTVDFVDFWLGSF